MKKNNKKTDECLKKDCSANKCIYFSKCVDRKCY